MGFFSFNNKNCVMFCKASVLKCPGLKEKKGSLHCFACRVIPFSYNGTPQVHFVRSQSPTLPPKGQCSMLAKSGAKCTKINFMNSTVVLVTFPNINCSLAICSSVNVTGKTWPHLQILRGDF